MGEFWSGPGCSRSPDFEFDHVAKSGVRMYRKVGKKTHIGDGPRGPVFKRAEREEGTRVSMEDLRKVVVKRLAGESDERVALVKAQLDAGTTSVSKVAAELALESLAKRARDEDPSRSLEQHYARVLDDPDNRDLVAELL